MGKTATFKIEGYIGPFDADFMKEGDKFTTSDMLLDFLNKNKAASDYVIEIDSNGGSTTHGFKMYDLLATCGKPVTTVGWNVKSIATAPFLAGSTRQISEHGEFLVHNPWIDPRNLGWSMTAADALRIHEDIKQEEDKLFNFYVDKINAKGKDAKILRAFMAKDVNMPISDVIEWGFATELIGEKKNIFKTLPVFAYSESMNLKQYKKDTMAVDKTAAKKEFATLSNAFAALRKLFGAEKVAASVTLEDGTTVLYHDGDLTEGSAVFMDEGMATPANDGDYILDNGTTITVTGGVVSAIMEVSAADETIAALKLRNATLLKEKAAFEKEAKEKYEALESKFNAEVTKNAEVLKQVEVMATSLAEFESKHFSTDGVKPKKVEAQAFTKEKEKEEPSRFTRLRKKIK